jgi:hypothetical protein
MPNAQRLTRSLVSISAANARYQRSICRRDFCRPNSATDYSMSCRPSCPVSQDWALAGLTDRRRRMRASARMPAPTSRQRRAADTHAQAPQTARLACRRAGRPGQWLGICHEAKRSSSHGCRQQAYADVESEVGHACISAVRIRWQVRRGYPGNGEAFREMKTRFHFFSLVQFAVISISG